MLRSVFFVLSKIVTHCPSLLSSILFNLGWDYAPTFSNSFTCAVLSLLYFVEEIRSTALRLQLCGSEMSIPSSGGVSVTAELGCLFHLIESLSSNGMIQPDLDDHKNTGQVKAFVPSNFIAAFTKLPEATNLALIDGVAGAADLARRPEAFYRFLMQYFVMKEVKSKVREMVIILHLIFIKNYHSASIKVYLKKIDLTDALVIAVVKVFSML